MSGRTSTIIPLKSLIRWGVLVAGRGVVLCWGMNGSSVLCRTVNGTIACRDMLVLQLLNDVTDLGGSEQLFATLWNRHCHSYKLAYLSYTTSQPA
jgi:hypothetical protein